MELTLTLLTALLAAALLIALIVALFLVLRTLQSVRKYIEKINFGVRAIEKETEMLGGVETLNGGLTALAGGLESVASHFVNVDRNVGTVGAALLR
ncbi:MAG: hypothetical protein H0V18_11645 [Pyrinomonadaceae bacterium]|nr:hypothetical protein [Pyrinomonadaceae bacterium]